MKTCDWNSSMANIISDPQVRGQSVCFKIVNFHRTLEKARTLGPTALVLCLLGDGQGLKLIWLTCNGGTRSCGHVLNKRPCMICVIRPTENIPQRHVARPPVCPGHTAQMGFK